MAIAFPNLPPPWNSQEYLYDDVIPSLNLILEGSLHSDLINGENLAKTERRRLSSMEGKIQATFFSWDTDEGNIENRVSRLIEILSTSGEATHGQQKFCQAILKLLCEICTRHKIASLARPITLIDQCIKDVEFGKLSFRNASIQRVTFNDCSFRKIDFTSAAIIGGIFTNCKFEGACFFGTTIQNSEFKNCDFLEAKLLGTNLTNVRWEKNKSIGLQINKIEIYRGSAVASTSSEDETVLAILAKPLLAKPLSQGSRTNNLELIIFRNFDREKSRLIEQCEDIAEEPLLTISRSNALVAIGGVRKIKVFSIEDEEIRERGSYFVSKMPAAKILKIFFSNENKLNVFYSLGATRRVIQIDVRSRRTPISQPIHMNHGTIGISDREGTDYIPFVSPTQQFWDQKKSIIFKDGGALIHQQANQENGALHWEENVITPVFLNNPNSIRVKWLQKCTINLGQHVHNTIYYWSAGQSQIVQLNYDHNITTNIELGEIPLRITSLTSTLFCLFFGERIELRKPLAPVFYANVTFISLNDASPKQKAVDRQLQSLFNVLP